MSTELVTISSVSSELSKSLSVEGISEILPSHISVDVFCRSAAIAMINNPDLMNADRRSVVTSLILAAKDGLVCDNREAALVLFKTKVNNVWINKAQYMPMVGGVIKRIKQSKLVESFTAKIVYEGDTFDYWIDENGEHLIHRPMRKSKTIQLWYAMARLRTGEIEVEVMDHDDINRVKAVSKTSSYDNSPWNVWFDKMGLKSTVHAIAKRIPNSGDLLDLMELNDQRDYGNQGNSAEKTKSIESKEIDIDDVFSDAEVIEESPIDQPEGESSDFDIDDVFNNTISKKDEHIDSINSCSNLGDLFEVGSYISESMENGELTEPEHMELKRAFQIKKDKF